MELNKNEFVVSYLETQLEQPHDTCPMIDGINISQ